jgi:DNA-binding FadR family transcriptional regulator
MAAAGLQDSPAHAERGRRLAALILNRSAGTGLRPGARLPTERELSVELGVTRSAVRHALAILEAEGKVSREVGRGTFLRDAPPWAAPDGRGDGKRPLVTAAAADFAPADVMTIRRLLEPPAMSLVVAWATAADLAEMERCLDGGDRATSYEEFETWDLALHRCIIAASRSPLLVTLYQLVEDARHGHAWGDMKRRSASPERRSEYQADHRAIVAALRARDAGQAVETMRLHLARVQEHLIVTDPPRA